jgi:hypothetical protein
MMMTRRSKLKNYQFTGTHQGRQLYIVTWSPYAYKFRNASEDGIFCNYKTCIIKICEIWILKFFYFNTLQYRYLCSILESRASLIQNTEDILFTI